MKILGFFKGIITRIPGFRRLSSSSMVIAATWYGAAILTMVKYWYWGLALLALPFFLFYLIDRNVMRNKRLCTIVSVTAGVLVLLGTASGLAAGGMARQAPPADMGTANRVLAVITATPDVSPASALPATDPPSVQPSLGLATQAQTTTAAISEATALPEVGEYAFVASRKGEVFHHPDCASARSIKAENLIGFMTREEAIAAGLRPCKRCKP